MTHPSWQRQKPSATFAGDSAVGQPRQLSDVRPRVGFPKFASASPVTLGRAWRLLIGLILLGQVCHGGTPQVPASGASRTQQRGQKSPVDPLARRRGDSRTPRRTVTSTRSGNWSSRATWGGSTPPGAGDIAIVNNAVRITSDTTIGDGSDSTVLDVTNGSLTIIGATLTIRGRSTFGKYNSGVTVGRLTVRSTSAVPGGIILDGDSGASPVMYVDNDTGLWFSGTSAVRCFVRTPRTTTGKPGRIADKGALRCFFLSASYTDFSRLGDASNPGLQARYVGTSNLSNPPFIMDHCTVDSSGQLPYLGVADGAVNFQLTNSTWTNGQSNTGYVLEATASGVISGGGTRKIDSCLFFGAPDFHSPAGFTITNNYFDQILSSGKNNLQWASFDGNFIRQPTTDEIQMAGNVSNCFILGNPANPATNLNGMYMSAYADSTVSGNVFQTTGTAMEGICISQTEGGTANRITAITNNIVLPNGAGDSTGILVFIANNITDVNWPTAVVEHNTTFIGTYVGVISGYTTKPTLTGKIQSFRSNIFWANSVHAGSYAVIGYYATPYDYPDPVSGANCDYNGTYNLPTVPKGTWNAPYDRANGSVYSLPLSAKPGVHDVADADPQFVDRIRNLQSWDAYLRGDGTIASALARLRANPSLTKSSLLPYIRAGFEPRNPAYRGGAHDRTDIGAVPMRR